MAPVDHIWYGVGASELNPFEVDRLRDAIYRLVSSAQELLSPGTDAANFLKTETCRCPQDYLALIQALRILSDLPDGSEEVISKSEWRAERNRITQIVERGKNTSLIREELKGRITGAAWNSDAAAMRKTIAAHGASFLRIFNGNYRTAIKEFRSLCVGVTPRRLPDRLALLDKLASYQTDWQSIEEEQEFSRTVFGAYWATEKTQWQAIERILQWTTEASKINWSGDLFSISRSMDRHKCIAKADILEKRLSEFTSAFDAVADIVSPDLQKTFGSSTFEGISIDPAVAKWAKWKESLEDFNGWVSVREALAKMTILGLGEVAEQIELGA
jgi:hypothetical protein